MAPFRETIRNTANHVVNVFQQKAQIQYQEGYLKLETNARVFKQSIETLASYMVPTDVDKSYENPNRKTLPPSDKKQLTYRTTTTGRIEKPQRQVSPAERDPKWFDMAMKKSSAELAREKEIRLQEIRLQETQRKMAEEKKRWQQLRAPPARWAMECRAGIKDSRPQWTPPPLPPYVPEKSPYSDEFYANQTPEERRRFINERLTNILGEERMNAPILPSGYNPIDPVIAEHNERVVATSIIEFREARRTEFQRHNEEQKFMARQAEQDRFRREVLSRHYLDIYKGRINKLAMYTGDMMDAIDLLDNALAHNDVWEAANAVQVLTHQILLPAHGLLVECDNEIPLDVEGAQVLNLAWPMARLSELYEFLASNANGLEPQVVYMCQVIEAIAQRINNPTPLVNTLGQKPQPTNNFCANNGFVNADPRMSVVSVPHSGSSISSTVPAFEGGMSIRGRASTRGVDPDAYIPGAATSAPKGSDMSKLMNATEENIASKRKAGSSAASKLPTVTVEPEDSVALQNVLMYIATDNMALEAELQDMFRNNDVKSAHRRAVKECLDGLMKTASGEKSILGTMDAGHYRSKIELCVTQIDALPRRPRQNNDTQALKKLCGRALKIWAVHE